MFKIHGKCDYFHFFFLFLKIKSNKKQQNKTSCPCKVAKTSPQFQFSNNKRTEL